VSNLDQQEQKRLQYILKRGEFRRKDAFRFVADITTLAKAGYGLLWADNPNEATLGVMAFEDEACQGVSVAYVQIEVSIYKQTIRNRGDGHSRALEAAFRTAQGRRNWLQALQETVKAMVEEAPVPPPTCWERILADD